MLTLQEILYYCIVEPTEDQSDKVFVFHRGGKDGAIIATATPCLTKRDATDLLFVDPKITVPISHKHHCHFKADGKSFYWRKEAMKEEEGEYHPSVFSGHHHGIVLSTIKPNLAFIQDLVVLTALITQLKEEEKLGPHTLARERAWELRKDME